MQKKKMKKKSEKKYFAFFENSPYLWNDPRIYSKVYRALSQIGQWKC